MNFSFWLKAVTSTPVLSKSEWEKIDFFSKWLVASRASYLILTKIAVFIILLLIIDAGKFNFLMWLLVSIGLMLAHAVNNLLNDYTDYVKKVDDESYFRNHYGTHILVKGFVTKTEFLLRYVLPPGLLAVLVGLLIIFLSPQKEIVWYLFILGSFLVVFYTFPLKKLALGELAVFLVWGPMMIGGGYYVITNDFDWVIFLATLPHACTVANVLLGVHIDKFSEDKAKKIVTLPVLIGEKASRYLVISFFIIPYIVVAVQFFIGFLNYNALLILLSLPALYKSVKIFASPRPTSAKDVKDKKMQPAWPVYFVAFSVQFAVVFGACYLLVLLVNLFT